jgi:peptidyl-dipeptidase A
MRIVEESKKYRPGNRDEARLLARLKSMADGTPKSKEDQRRLSEIISKMTSIYSTSRYNGMALEPDLTEVLANSRDYDAVLDAYIGWRNVTGPKIKPLYSEFVKLYNKGARESGPFQDASDFW